MVHSSSSLERLDLSNRPAAPGWFDLILDRCPNLRYFSVDNLNGEQMRKLPLKTPNLQYLKLCYMTSYSDPIIDDLAYLMENLPNLRQLLVDGKLYRLLLGQKRINLLCRRKRLSVITQPGVF
uniref:Uncharacterized protein n=1 Tax=Romanomermis culicivorax TaxID=13658 RepID=A0A915JJK1_ROMCU